MSARDRDLERLLNCAARAGTPVRGVEAMSAPAVMRVLASWRSSRESEWEAVRVILRRGLVAAAGLAAVSVWLVGHGVEAPLVDEAVVVEDALWVAVSR